MHDLPLRTGVTELSDDELLLFDFLFDTGVENKFLRRQKYSVHMNVRYTHELDDCQLETTLKSLQKRGLIERESKTEPPYEGWVVNRLTPSGGRLWELERRPIWEKYAIDSDRPLSWRNMTGLQLTTIRSPSNHSCREYLELAIQSEYIKLAGRKPQIRTVRMVGSRLVPWKRFSESHLVVAKSEPNFWQRGSNNIVELEAHNEAYRRFWNSCMLWRNLAELDRLHRKLDKQ